MEWILIASVLNWQPAYADQETCQLAAEELKKVYYQEVAACIPKPNDVEQKTDRMFEQFMGMIKEMQKLDKKTVDNTSN
jgi:hypothetical protein